MSYYDEQKSKHGARAVCTDACTEACTEVDRVRAAFILQGDALGEARNATEELQAEVDSLRTDLAAARAEAERAKVENGAIHGKIGLLAERLYGINNNLPTDETIERLAQCVQGDQMRLKRMEMTHDAFDADMVDFMQKVQIGEVTCIRAAQVIEAKLTDESDHLYAIDQLTQANAALEAENRGLRSGFVAIGQKHKADSIEYIWWCGGYPKEGALVYVTRDALTEEQLATLAPKEGNAP